MWGHSDWLNALRINTALIMPYQNERKNMTILQHPSRKNINKILGMGMNKDRPKEVEKKHSEFILLSPSHLRRKTTTYWPNRLIVRPAPVVWAEPYDSLTFFPILLCEIRDNFFFSKKYISLKHLNLRISSMYVWEKNSCILELGIFLILYLLWGNHLQTTFLIFVSNLSL